MLFFQSFLEFTNVFFMIQSCQLEFNGSSIRLHVLQVIFLGFARKEPVGIAEKYTSFYSNCLLLCYLCYNGTWNQLVLQHTYLCFNRIRLGTSWFAIYLPFLQLLHLLVCLKCHLCYKMTSLYCMFLTFATKGPVGIAGELSCISADCLLLLTGVLLSSVLLLLSAFFDD